MNCLFCQSPNTDVKDSRINPDGLVRRRRSCRQCKGRFSTLEVSIEQPLPVHIPLGLSLSIGGSPRILKGNGCETSVRPQVADLLQVLLQEWPRLVTHDMLANKVWGKLHPGSYDNIKKHVSDANQDLLKVGALIVGARERGYTVALYEEVAGSFKCG